MKTETRTISEDRNTLNTHRHHHGTTSAIKGVCHKVSDSLHHRHQKRHLNLDTPVDVFEETNGFIVLVDVAGAREEDIQVTVEGDTLHVHGKTTESAHRLDAGLKSRAREFEDGEFCRRIRLGGEIDVEQIEAHITQGIMTLHLPKLKISSHKNISVEVA